MPRINQCVAYAANGRRCKKEKKDGFKWCWMHNPKEVPNEDVVKSDGIIDMDIIPEVFEDIPEVIPEVVLEVIPEVIEDVPEVVEDVPKVVLEVVEEIENLQNEDVFQDASEYIDEGGNRNNVIEVDNCRVLMLNDIDAQISSLKNQIRQLQNTKRNMMRAVKKAKMQHYHELKKKEYVLSGVMNNMVSKMGDECIRGRIPWKMIKEFTDSIFEKYDIDRKNMLIKRAIEGLLIGDE